MSSQRARGVICQLERPIEVDAGTLCRSRSRPPRTVGVGGGVRNWPARKKLIEAARRATLKVPAGMRKEFAALFDAQNIAITGGVLGVWGVSHFFGVGEAVDVILLVGGAAILGSQVWSAAGDLKAFLSLATHASSEHDLDLAAEHLARVVAVVGVAVFVAIVLKAGSKFGKAAKAARQARYRPAAPLRLSKQPMFDPGHFRVLIEGSTAECKLKINGSKVILDYIKRGDQPKGSAGYILAEAMRHLGVGKPTVIEVPNILPKPELGNSVQRRAMSLHTGSSCAR